MISVVKKVKSRRAIKRDISEIENFIENNVSGYEVITGKCIPYYEADFIYETKKIQEENKLSDFKKAYDEIKTYYGAIKKTPNPIPKVYTFDSSGYVKAKDKWKNSFHFRIRGAGHYRCGLDLQKMEHCDKAPYKDAGKRQLLRLVGCSKEGDSRVLLRFKDGRTYQMDEIKELDEKPSDYIVQNIEDEKLVNVVSFTSKEFKNITKITPADKKIYLNAKTEYDFHPTIKSIIKMVACLSAERAEAYDTWLRVVICIKNMADTYDMDLSDQLHAFSSLSDKYDKSEVTKLYNKEIPTKSAHSNIQGYHFGSLCYWAKIDNPEQYKISLKTLKDGHVTKLIKILDDCKKSKRKYQYADYRKFQYKNISKDDEYEIWKYLTDSIIHVIDCGQDKIFTVNQMHDGEIKFGLMSIKPFNGSCHDVMMNVDNQTRNMSEYFTKYYQLRAYAYMDFIPYLKNNPTPHDVFNLFQGFKYSHSDISKQKPQMSKISKILYHLREVICDGDEKIFDYMLKWTAHLFRKPAEKIGVAVLLHSAKQGAGKNKWCDFLMDLLGSELWYKSNKIEDLTSKFNYHMQGKLLIIGDEIANYAGYKVADQLKALLTETHMAIEPKGKDPYCIKSFERYIMTTNSDVPLRIANQDRRYLTLSVSEKHAQDVSYFAPLSAEMENEESQLMFLRYLMTVDIDNWNFRDIPMNNYKKSLVAESIDNVHEFIGEWIQNNPKTTKVSTSKLFNGYIEYCEGCKYKAYDMRRFTKNITKLKITKKRNMFQGHRTMRFIIDHEVVKKELNAFGVDSEKGSEPEPEKGSEPEPEKKLKKLKKTPTPTIQYDENLFSDSDEE